MRNTKGDRLLNYGKHKILGKDGNLISKTIWKNQEGTRYVKVNGIFTEVICINGRYLFK